MILMILLFSLSAILVAWYGQRLIAIGIFSASFIFATAWFFHHMTSKIGLTL